MSLDNCNEDKEHGDLISVCVSIELPCGCIFRHANRTQLNTPEEAVVGIAHGMEILTMVLKHKSPNYKHHCQEYEGSLLRFPRALEG